MPTPTHLNWGTNQDGATILVQAGFGFAPATAIGSVTWTDITAYVRNLSIKTGRSDELDSYQAGRLSMTLDNRDRRFDPLHATSPYAGNLKPMTRVRVQLTYSGTTVTMFSGYISGFPQAYDPPRDATTTVNASDGFAVLARARLSSLYAYEVYNISSPTIWWRFGEQAGSTVVSSSVYLNTDGVYEGGAVFNSRNGLIVDSDNAIAFTAPQTAFKGGYVWPSSTFAIEFWFSTTLPAASFYFPVLVNGSGSSLSIAIQSGQISANWSDGAGKQANRFSTLSSYNDGLTHYVNAYWPNGATVPTLYIDGVADTTGATGLTATVAALGTVTINVPSPYTPLWVGTIDEFAMFQGGLNAGRVAIHWAAGSAPFAGLDTGAVISKVLDMAGWPTADRSIETGQSTVTAFDCSGKTALDVIRSMEATEQGRFFISAAGVATFYNRHHVLTTAASTTSQATFGDNAGELPYGDLELDFDEDKIRNKIVASRQGGSAYTAIDLTSIGDYLEREYSITGLYNSDDGEIRDLATWVLAHYKDPVTRVPDITIKPRRAPTTLFPHIRDRKFLDRITVKRRPQAVGTAVTLDVLIEGIEHQITVDPLDWITKWFLSPAELQDFFILDDAVLGKLGLNSLAF